ncbi:hypothetical protein IWX64_003131 [Arthrobacter sp. CAN_A212]
MTPKTVGHFMMASGALMLVVFIAMWVVLLLGTWDGSLYSELSVHSW